MQWFAFDSMGEFAFNKDFGMLRTHRWHDVLIKQRGALALLGPLNAAVWSIRLAFAFLPFVSRVKDWMGMIHFCDRCIEERRQVGIMKIDRLI